MDFSRAAKEPGKGCFIANAVYVSADHPKVLASRRFSHRLLEKNAAGRVFVAHLPTAPSHRNWTAASNCCLIFENGRNSPRKSAISEAKPS